MNQNRNKISKNYKISKNKLLKQKKIKSDYKILKKNASY